MVSISNKAYFFIGLSLLGIAVAVLLFWPRDAGLSALSEPKAIDLVKENFPELEDYPSDNLPPRSISAEKDPLGWRISFIQEGSGRPVLGAKCFLVKNVSGFISVIFLGGFSNVSMGMEEKSLKACKAGCMMQECHGLDVSCGMNAPDLCTEIYGLGDRCRRLAECVIADGECIPALSREFESCKACVLKCDETEGRDPTALFGCESKCG